MSKEVLSKEKKALLFGNESVVRACLESGVGFSASYPGTPASEIGTVLAEVSKETGLYFEWSTNEKVALEAAAGAAFSGVKSITAMKHYGLNVVSDSLLPLTYLECPLVVVVADDPGCFSSIETEQDTRWYSKMGYIPMLEPSSPEETMDVTKKAFEIAWKYKIPVIIRLTTRVCYTRSIINLSKIPKINSIGRFEKPINYEGSCSHTVLGHEKLLNKIELLKKLSEKSELNFTEAGTGNVGIITSGVSYRYVKEVFDDLKIKLPLLKIGMSYPMPEEKIKNFCKKLKKVLIVEEVDPIIENEVKCLTNNLEVHGKDFLSSVGEYNTEIVLSGICKILNKKFPKDIENIGKQYNNTEIEPRIPFLCAGCPHRSTFYAIRKVIPDAPKLGDIGCYLLGSWKPEKIEDIIVSMGAGISLAHGVSKSTNKKTVAFIGDSTFFHAGVPALLNLVYNKSDILLVILDNRWTAMTGHQPTLTTGRNATEEAKIIDIAEIVKACQVDNYASANVYNMNELLTTVKDLYSKKGVSVLIAKGECKLAYLRRLAKEKKNYFKFEVYQQNSDLKELDNFKCPAIFKENGKYSIDANLCWGCTVCKQLAPSSIKIKTQ
ncbi:MAG: thiamine pyrophosphate-dependent enzyme [Candidatus Nanoarchaeia archaeon]